MTLRHKLLLGAMLGLAGCATGSKAAGGAGSGLKSAELYPLAVGNTWTYAAEMLGDKRDLTITIVGEDQGRFTDTTGNVLQADPYGVRDEKRYLVRDPVEVGTTWNNVVSVSSKETYRINEVGVSCKVAAGSFENCVVVESKNVFEGTKALVNEMTFVPKVGLVKVAVSLEADGKRVPQSSVELTKYELQKKAAVNNP